MIEENEGSIAAAIIWMFVISILLFWLPFIGLLIAGVVGGRAAGGVGSALVAVLAPCVVLSVVMFFVGTLLSVIPVIGWIIGGVAAAGAERAGERGAGPRGGGEGRSRT